MVFFPRKFYKVILRGRRGSFTCYWTLAIQWTCSAIPGFLLKKKSMRLLWLALPFPLSTCPSWTWSLTDLEHRKQQPGLKFPSWTHPHRCCSFQIKMQKLFLNKHLSIGDLPLWQKNCTGRGVWGGALVPLELTHSTLDKFHFLFWSVRKQWDFSWLVERFASSTFLPFAIVIKINLLIFFSKKEA